MADDKEIVTKMRVVVTGVDGLDDQAMGAGAKFFSGLMGKMGFDFGNMSSAAKLGGAGQMAGAAGDALMKVMQTTMGIIQDIYKKIVEASPLLQAVETLFNLAMQLFFMPLGNKLADEFLPAILDMIDKVMGMWDAMEGMKLSDMVDYMVDQFFKIFVQFFIDIGKRLETHGGLIGSIGKLITTLSSFVKDKLAGLLTWMINLASFMAEHFPTLIGLIIGFKLVMVELMIAQLYATATSNTIGGWFGAGMAVAGAATMVAAPAITNVLMADGGYVPSTPGGSARILGEGGEGEFVVPESKVDNFISSYAGTSASVKARAGGGDSYTINVYGYTDSELGSIIEDKVNELSNRSRLRGGF